MRQLRLVDQRFGRLVVVKQLPTMNYTRWLCRCDCGNYTEASSLVLRNGDKKSCGCFRKQRSREWIEKMRATNEAKKTAPTPMGEWRDLWTAFGMPV